MKPLVMVAPQVRPVRASSRTVARAAGSRSPGTVRQLYRLLVDGGRWWLVPLMVVLALTGVLLAVVSAIEYVAPFVYTIF